MTVAATLFAAKDLRMTGVPLDSVPATGSGPRGRNPRLGWRRGCSPGGILEPTAQDALGIGPGQTVCLKLGQVLRQGGCGPGGHTIATARPGTDPTSHGARAMTAISVEKPNTLAVVEHGSTAPERGEVLVRVHRAGICGSDVHILHGSNPFARYPRIIGHEFAGEIEAVGPDVSDFARGDRVVVDPVVSCGNCYACRIGRPNVCANLEVFGVHRDGGFRNLVPVPARNIVKVSPDLPVEIAALAEPFSIAANVLSRTGCGPEDTVLIYGAGTVGLTVLQVAKLKGARCLVSDIDEARLERARSFGADAVINPRSTSVVEAVSGEMGGLGPSVVIDGAGVPALLEEACRVASPAGRIGLLGFSPAPCNVSQQEIVKKELTLVGSRLNRHLLPEVVQWLESGSLKPAAMITQTFDAKDARAAFDLVENHPERTVKVQFVFGDA
jgi:L-gulonate 5-dehydrogenase